MAAECNPDATTGITASEARWGSSRQLARAGAGKRKVLILFRSFVVLNFLYYEYLINRKLASLKVFSLLYLYQLFKIRTFA